MNKICVMTINQIGISFSINQTISEKDLLKEINKANN